MRATFEGMQAWAVYIYERLVVMPRMRIRFALVNFKLRSIRRRNAMLRARIAQLHADIAILKAKT